MDTMKGTDKRKTVQLPPVWCAQLCRNAMNQVCVEYCAIEKNCASFELKIGMNLEDMPRFPIEAFTTDMTAKERMICIGIYTAKMVDHLQGVKDERHFNPYSERALLNRLRNRENPADLQSASLPSDSAEGTSLYPAFREADRDSGE